MLAILQLLLYGHVHKWKTIRVNPYSLWDKTPKDIIAEGTRYTQQCEHCGIVVKRDII